MRSGGRYPAASFLRPSGEVLVVEAQVQSFLLELVEVVLSSVDGGHGVVPHGRLEKIVASRSEALGEDLDIGVGSHDHPSVVAGAGASRLAGNEFTSANLVVIHLAVGRGDVRHTYMLPLHTRGCKVNRQTLWASLSV